MRNLNCDLARGVLVALTRGAVLALTLVTVFATGAHAQSFQYVGTWNTTATSTYEGGWRIERAGNLIELHFDSNFPNRVGIRMQETSFTRDGVTYPSNGSWGTSLDFTGTVHAGRADQIVSGTVVRSFVWNNGRLVFTLSYTHNGEGPCCPSYSYTETETGSGVLYLDGGDCTITMTSPSAIPATGGDVPITVVTNRPECEWSVTVDAPWLTGSASGMGSGHATFSARPNAGAARTATLSWPGGSSFLTQDAGALDLWVDDAEPVQVVYGVPLIKGKPTAIHAWLRASSCAALAGRLQNGVTVRIANGETTVSKSLAGLDFVPDYGSTCLAEAIVVWPNPPAAEGPFEIRVTVDSEDTVGETVETNNDWHKSFDVVAGGRLRLLYVRIPECDTRCYGTATMPVEETVSKSNEIISTLFPVSPQDFSGTVSNASIRGASEIGDRGLLTDFRAVKRLGVRVDPLADKFLGVVPFQYFSYHGMEGNAGVSLPGVSDVALMSNFSPKTAAHELGHLFGLWNFIERYSLPWSPVQQGFWVQRNTPVINATSIMGSDSHPDHTGVGMNGFWIDYQEYVDLAKALPTGSDPEALLISGIVDRSGLVTLDPLLYLPQAILDESDGFEADRTLEIRVLDHAGAVVGHHVRPLFFMRRGDSANEPADTTPFAIRVAFPPTASTVEVRVDDHVAVRLDANITTLSDALMQVPVELFQKPGENRRRALLNKIEALGRQVSNKREAINKLANDIRPHVLAWLSAEAPQTPLHLSRSDVLAIIDALIARWSM